MSILVTPADHHHFAIRQGDGGAVIATILEVKGAVTRPGIAQFLRLVVKDHDVLAAGERAQARRAVIVATHDDDIARRRIERHVAAKDVGLADIGQRAVNIVHRIPKVENEDAALHALFGGAEGQHIAIRQHDRMERDDRPVENRAPLAIAFSVVSAGWDHLGRAPLELRFFTPASARANIIVN